MVDVRIEKIAKILVEYSTEVKKGDRVLIRTTPLARDLALEVYKQCLLKGAYPWIRCELPGQSYIFFKYANEDQLKWFPEHEYEEIKRTDVYIYISGEHNTRELSNIDPAKISTRMKTLKPILDYRVENTRWVIFDYPTEALAQEAEMSVEEFRDFVFNACLLDWKELSEKMRVIKERMKKVDKIRIVGEKTDLEFSIKGREIVIADGKHNMPDGEIFTSVVEDSVNGYIFFDMPAVKMGQIVENIYLRFKDGVIVEYDAERNKKFLERMINTDDGSKRIGEFGIGLNYNITRPVRNILFDEKIGGTIHLAIGKGYKETGSKNDSAIHWDLIKDMRKSGSKIYFDDELVFENGKWLLI